MKKWAKVIGLAVVSAMLMSLALFMSGLATTGITDSNGDWVSMTTIKLGVNEFALLMIVTVLVSVGITSLAVSTSDKTEPKQY